MGPEGTFRLCSSLWHPDTVYDLRAGTLREAWEEWVPRVRDLRGTDPEFLEKCRTCEHHQPLPLVPGARGPGDRRDGRLGRVLLRGGARARGGAGAARWGAVRVRRTSAPGQPLSPETWALLACAQAVVDERRLPAFREAVAACTSAERLCSAAVQHGMVGHLHRLIAAQPDPSFAAFVAEPLAKLYRTSMQRNLHQAAELLRLLEQLRELGVEAMPIKGPALAEALYGDVTLRNWVDLDLVVRHEQVATARQVLLDVGFRDDSPYNERLLLRRDTQRGRDPLAHGRRRPARGHPLARAASAEPAPTDSAARLSSRAHARCNCSDATFGVRARTT